MAYIVDPDSTTIYIIDDDRSVRVALGRLFRSAGLNTLDFDSCEAFLECDFVASRSCVIADIRMPGAGGLQLPGLLAERGSNLPVILLSALDRDDAVEEAKLAGAVALFRKPADGQALLDAIEWATRNGVAG